jgi:hypothetical protein
MHQEYYGYFVPMPAAFGESHPLPLTFQELRRAQDSMKPLMPIRLVATFVAVGSCCNLCDGTRQPMGCGRPDAFRFNDWVFTVCGFVLYNYVNLNIGLRLMLL